MAGQYIEPMLDDAAAGAGPSAPWWRAAGQYAVCRCWAGGMLCGAYLADTPPFDECRVNCDYAFPCNWLMGDFKFDSHAELSAALAGLMLRALRASTVERSEGALPVQLALRRLAGHGCNQARALAQRVAREPDCPARAEVLLRPLEGAHPSGPTLAQRRTNKRGAFIMAPAQRSWAQGRRLALVDDVMTSGEPLCDAAASLRRATTSRTGAWMQARTPSPTTAG
jgi:predicted amidophosphoribosyltransferase